MPGGTVTNTRSCDCSGRSLCVSGILGTSPVPTMRPAFAGPAARSTQGAAYTSPGRIVGAAMRIADGLACAGCCAITAVGATRAPTIAIAMRLERKIVVLIIQRSREILEVVAGCARRALCALGCAAATHSGTALGVVTVAAAAAAAQHDQLTNVDLGAVSGLTVLVRPLSILDSPLDVELVAFLDVLLDDVGELRTLRVPDDAAVPLRLFLTVARLVVPGTTGGERKGCNAVAAGGGPDLGIGPEVPDQRHLVQASAHNSSWRVMKCSPRKVGVRADTPANKSVRVKQFGCE